MTHSRRLLPPTSHLCAFEAAARHNSFTATAEELNLTQSAVSKRIGALEDLIGRKLFIRHRQTIKLRADAHTYALEIREALKTISTATLNAKNEAWPNND